ncbi:MAG: hypothetical protein KKH44_04810 [Bacteroidetes bacterium]|nr:hypothetical protein [Bacteroidota bacterium]
MKHPKEIIANLIRNKLKEIDGNITIATYQKKDNPVGVEKDFLVNYLEKTKEERNELLLCKKWLKTI